MKTKLNLICIMVFAVMVADLWGGWFEFDVGSNAADYEMGMVKEGEHMVTDAWYVRLLPYCNTETAITVRNDITGEELRAWPTQIYVEPLEHEEFKGWGAIVQSIFALVAAVAFIIAVCVFVGFIVRVNRDHIFDWKNVKLLRWAGAGLLLYGIISSVWAVVGQVDTMQKFRLKGYAVDWLSGIEFTPLMLGLIAFVAAQVFAMGVKMKEEQELTI